MPDKFKKIDRIDMDNGSLPIAKDILRVLAKTNLSPRHLGIIYAVLDKTYGWHNGNSKKKKKIKQRKTEEYIKLNCFAEFTRRAVSHTSTAVNDLVKWHVILRSERRPYKYSLNVNVNEWAREIFCKKCQEEGWGQVTTSRKLRPLVSKVTGTRKFPNNIYRLKETIRKKRSESEDSSHVPLSEDKSKGKPRFSPEHLELAQLLAARIRENPKLCKCRVTDEQIESWANEVRLMVERDGHSLEDIRLVVDWCQGNPFWYMNILSMAKLREKFGRLWAEMEDDKNSQLSQKRELEEWEAKQNATLQT